jgi:hypothetical protein
MSIFEEDLDLQQRAPSGLEIPLDIAAELHTRADRIPVEFRPRARRRGQRLSEPARPAKQLLL